MTKENNILIAVCTDTENFNQNRMFDYDFAKNHFGLAFAQLLKELMPNLDFATGDITFEKIKKDEIKCKNIYVISEQNSKLARKLIKKGAIPLCTYCFESLIYARKFYKNIQNWSDKFKNTIYFQGQYKEFKQKKSLKTFHSYFPSYDESDIIVPKSIKNRGFISLVMGNKYTEHSKNIKPNTKSLKRKLKWLFNKFIYENKYSKYLRKNELQTKRLELIELFGRNNLLGLYGNSWDNLLNLPDSWQKRLNPMISALDPKPVDNKFETISNYKFNLCLENLSYDGYITEKIIQSFVAGSVPVYIGAPDVLDFIPQNCFIDIRNFKSNEELIKHLKSLTDEEILKYIKNGREFLSSENGQKYSFRYFATQLKEIIEREIKCTAI